MLGIEIFSGTGATLRESWSDVIAPYAQALETHGAKPRLWVTGTGFSTWRHDERGQIRAFLGAAEAPVERVYWSSLRDLDPLEQGAQGFHADERDYFNGILRADGSPKLLGRLLEKGGIAAVRALYRLGRPMPVTPARADKPVVITGGAGFIGTNLADRLVRRSTGHRLDNLSRPGVEQNIAWLKATHGNAVTFELADIRDPYVLRDAVAQAGRMFHFAAQVAVTTSLADPIADFEVNAEARQRAGSDPAQPEPPPLIFTSTNKVYGNLADLGLELDASVCAGRPRAPCPAASRVAPARLLQPVWLLQGRADQYVLDYAAPSACRGRVPHELHLRSAPVRDRGPGLGRPFPDPRAPGRADHALRRRTPGARPPVRRRSGGCFPAAQTHMEAISGHAFNIGGGPGNVFSLLELLQLIGQVARGRPPVAIAEPRPGDQLYYVSDTGKFGDCDRLETARRGQGAFLAAGDWLTEIALPRRLDQREAAG